MRPSEKADIIARVFDLVLEDRLEEARSLLKMDLKVIPVADREKP